MSILSTVGAAAVSGIWKAGAIAALAVGAASSSYLGYQWHMAAHDRDTAVVERNDARDSNATLTASIREQNRAVEAMVAMKALADDRRAAAEQLAAANGRRFDRALEQAAGARATTCGDAMPTVNKILEAVR